MPIPLWTLLGLNVRAAFRRIGRQLRTVKGAILVLLGLSMLALWLGSAGLSGRYTRPPDAAAVRTYGPLLVLFVCGLNVVTSAGDRAVSFTPAEVDFLFPGPFTRRQLVVYKLVKTGLGALASALLFALARGWFGGTFLGRAVGVWLTFQFAQLISMSVAFVGASIGERAASAGRRWAIGGGLAVAAAVVVPVVARQGGMHPAELAAHLGDGPLGRAVLLPFAVFARAVTSRHLAEAVRWDAAAVAIDLALVALVIGLDANYLEVAAAAGARRHARVARMRQGGIAGMATAGTARLRLPQLPWLGGAGPIAWRQLTTVVRTGRGLLVILGIIALGAGGAVSRADSSTASITTLATVSGWTILFLTSLLKFDFRGDVDQIDGLRALPVAAVAVAAGELVAPTVVLSAVQAVLIGAAAAFGRLPGAWLATAGAFVVPVNSLVLGSENLIFLWFPYRPTSAVAGDMGMVGRQTVVFLCRLVVLIAVGVVAGAFGFGTYLLLGRSQAAGAAVAWLVTAAAVVGVVLLMGLAFTRFDPSVDTPA